MSRRGSKAAACDRKSAFPTMKGAENSMYSLLRREARIGFLSAYKCPHYPGYHFGHLRGGAESRQKRLLDRIDAAVALDAKRASRA